MQICDCDLCGYIAEASQIGTRFPSSAHSMAESAGKYKDFTSSFLLHEDKTYDKTSREDLPNGKWVNRPSIPFLIFRGWGRQKVQSYWKSVKYRYSVRLLGGKKTEKYWRGVNVWPKRTAYALYYESNWIATRGYHTPIGLQKKANKLFGNNGKIF